MILSRHAGIDNGQVSVVVFEVCNCNYIFQQSFRNNAAPHSAERRNHNKTTKTCNYNYTITVIYPPPITYFGLFFDFQHNYNRSIIEHMYIHNHIMPKESSKLSLNFYFRTMMSVPNSPLSGEPVWHRLLGAKIEIDKFGKQICGKIGA